MNRKLLIFVLLLAAVQLLRAGVLVSSVCDTSFSADTLAVSEESPMTDTVAVADSGTQVSHLRQAVASPTTDTVAVADSIRVKTECQFMKDWKRKCPGDEVHRFRPTTLIVPTLMFATGATIAFNPYLKSHVDEEVTKVMYTQTAPCIRVEDYIQYTPAVAPYVLNLCGLKGQHGYRDLLNLTAASYLFSVSMLWPIKYTAGVERPNGRNLHSFPSGHTMTAFAGAEILRREYRDYPLVGICGYAVAATVGAMRIYHGYHWFSDVLAGAAIGILGTSIAYWLAPYLRF